MGQAAKHSAFSLVEVLVVIAIIALMIALLLPALSQARQAARGSACLSNLRQISFAFPMYHAEFRNWYPVGSGWSQSTYPLLRAPTWSRVAAHTLGVPYITEQNVAHLADYGQQQQSYYLKERNNGIFQCPTDDFGNYWGGKNATTYRYNAGHDNSIGWGYGSSDYYRVAYPAKGSYGDTTGRVRTYQVDKPATTFLLGETSLVRDVRDYAADYVVRQFYRPEFGGDWHNSAGNYLWGDGHATKLNADQLKRSDFDRRQ